MIVDVDYNQQWFLHVPDPRPDAPAEEARVWASHSVDSFNVVQEWNDPGSRDELVDTLVEQATLFTTDAVVGFLYCPRGLPATAIVEIAVGVAEGSGALAALDALPMDETALPRQVTDVSTAHLGNGVLVHGVASAGEDSLVGIANYSFVSDGAHILITITTPDLNAIAVGRAHFDEFVEAITLSD